MKNTPMIMGIINATSDSFYEDSRSSSIDMAINKAEIMIAHGASIIDIGGCSTRPHCAVVDESTEKSNVIPVIEAIRQKYPHTTLSIDTFRASVACEAITKGADIINDISGGEFDPNILNVVQNSGKTYVLTHNRGLPHIMNLLTDYTDICSQVVEYFDHRIKTLQEMGINDIIIDPGFGFAKTVEQNFTLLAHANIFKKWGLPLLVGISRKSMIWKTLDTTPATSLNGTTVLNTIALMRGADILRVHDVKEAVEAVKLVEMISNN